MSKYGKGYDNIQLNDKISTADDVAHFILKRINNIPDSERPFMTTSLKADKESTVGTMADIREKLREVNALKLNLSAHRGDVIKK
ncbi:hypothetical protein [Tenacibaculum xiamenense]|uniref:hypothetical protein n=1 Tax=Tenacibaculum xiamenense TaxID=1261553 RepID=UPI0038B68B4B